MPRPGLAPDEEGVVRPGGGLGDGEGGGVREAVGRADDERVEGIAAIEADVVGRRVLRPVGEVARPTLLGAGEGFLVVVDLIGVRNRVGGQFVG